MVAVQTTYTATIQPGAEGMLGTMYEDSSVDSRNCETAAGIAFGRAVSEGANSGGAVLGGATRFIGLTVRDITLVAKQGQTVDLYQQYQEMGVLLKGEMWVRPVAAVTHGAPATYDSTTGQLNPATAGVAIPASRYITSAGAGQLALLQLTAAGPGA
jgi:hypothetical protein